MLRKIITIDQEKCTGCGLCATACHEGAIVMENGKANLLRDDYCDGLGDCLPVCEAGAIHFEMREASPFDKVAVATHMATSQNYTPLPDENRLATSAQTRIFDQGQDPNSEMTPLTSQLMQWPIQLRLAPATNAYYQDAHLLIAADCTAFAHANFNQAFMRDKITLIGCPKLDDTEYTEKCTTILKENDIASITLIKMEVPCCSSLEKAVKQANLASGKHLPCEVLTLGLNGIIKKE